MYKRVWIAFLIAILASNVSFAYVDLPPWFESGMLKAEYWRIVPDAFQTDALRAPIRRIEFTEVVVRAYVSTIGELPSHMQKGVFKDVEDPFVTAAFELGIVTGYPDDLFLPDALIRREEMFVMIKRLADQIYPTQEKPMPNVLSAFIDFEDIAPWAKEAAGLLVQKNIVKGTDLGTINPKANATRTEALVMVLNLLEAMEPVRVSDAQMHFALTGEKTESLVTSRGQQRSEAIAFIDTLDPMLITLGENASKYSLVFGDLSNPRYESEEEALLNMVQISVDVWSLDSNGTKTPSIRTLTVHKAVAELVQAIFKEIFEGPEKFPIKDLHGYAWRQSPTSEHRLGLAIDLNYDENYMVMNDGRVVAGSFWLPNENPFSIRPDGDVVKAFKKYGFSWGGDAWPNSKDYMHFSYFGR